MASKLELESLPWLISRKEVQRVFGLGKAELVKMEKSGVIHRLKNSRKGKYFVEELIAITRRPAG